MMMKSIYRLKFKEPTPIQNACIPAAAHQGKDVIGAVETGSGKTLVFGLPILHCLLEEREKVERLMVDKAEANEGIAPQGVVRALIITPTRELALQMQCLSFFLLDEADRMIESGHFRELQSIIDMLPMSKESTESQPENKILLFINIEYFCYFYRRRRCKYKASRIEVFFMEPKKDFLC